MASEQQQIRGQRMAATFKAALPIMLGYIVLGLPAGILCHTAGMSVLQTFLLTACMYSGAGQYMVPNMLLAGSPVGAVMASVALVNTRQMLYASSLAPFFKGVGKGLSTLFAGTVTDESFGVNLFHLEVGNWTPWQATGVNLFSFATWVVSVTAGAVIGSSVSIPTAIASFAMTSIFICLLASQRFNASKAVAGLAAAVGVIACKLLGVGGVAIFAGAVFGIVVGMLMPLRNSTDQHQGDAAASPRKGDER